MALRVPRIQHENKVCESCMVGKQTAKPFPNKASYRATQLLELIHGDICGPITPSTMKGNRHILVLIDDYMWCSLLKEKQEAFSRIKLFITMVERETGKKVKVIRTDRGGEFTSKSFNEYCEQEGIMRHLTAPYTPQQNGVVERRNRTLMEMTRSIMKAMKVPIFLWGKQ